MAYVVDENGNAKTTLNVVVPTLHDKVVAGKDVIPLSVGGVVLVDKGIKELTKKAETVPVPKPVAGPGG